MRKKYYKFCTQKRNVILILLILFILPFNTVLAQDTTPSDDDVNRIASQLFCPVCENIPLDVCALEACVQWRSLIREQLAEGWTEEDIKNYFVAQYGDRVLGVPPRRGLNWLLYLLPPAVILLSLGLLFAKLRRPVAEKTAISETIDDPYINQVERDLEKMNRS